MSGVHPNIRVAVRPAARGGRRGSAFTLLELLLATAIFSIVIMAINTVFFAALHLRKSTTDALDESLPIERTFAILRRDLENAAAPGGVLAGHFRNGGAASAFGSGTASGSANTSARTALSGSATTSSSSAGSSAASKLSASSMQGGLDFFASTGVIRDNTVGGDIQEVNYQLMDPLDEGKALGQDLVRSVTRNLLSFMTPVPEQQRLLKNVESLEFEFYDGLEWRQTWDTSLTDTNLPMAVRVRLLPAVAPERQSVRREPFEIVVLLNQGGAGSTQQSDTNSVSGGVQ